MGWKSKIFRKKIKYKNPYAEELSNGDYYPRIKESEKTYSRKKIKVKDIYKYEESSD
jgi:hypothetical protein